jgi:DNA-binding SARP family transcriptional activator
MKLSDEDRPQRSAPTELVSPATSTVDHSLRPGPTDKARRRMGDSSIKEIPPAEKHPLVRLALLKGFRLTHGNQLAPLVISVQRVIAFLALQEGAMPRAYVAGMLWPDVSEKRAAGSLRSALWRLKGCALNVVNTLSNEIQLAPHVAVDLREAHSLSQRVLASSSGCLDEALERLALFTDELLPGWYEDWVLMQRERHRQVSLCALEVLCEALSAQRRFRDAVVVGLAAINAEPLRESAHRALIKAHLGEDNVAEAIRRYRAYCQLLLLELNLKPSGQLEALIRASGSE